MGPAADRPATTLPQNSSTVEPAGVIRPSPVMTARRRRAGATSSAQAGRAAAGEQSSSLLLDLLPNVKPPVYLHDLPGDEGGRVTGQEEDQVGHFGRVSRAADRGAGDYGPPSLLGQ